MTASASLTVYATIHLKMIEIDRRFEAVVARHPMRKEPFFMMRVGFARDSAKRQRDDVGYDLNRINNFKD